MSVQTEPEHLVQAARSLWNLRQFDLAPRHRGLGVLAERWRLFMGPAWRPVRLGLGALALVHLLGLNLWAWEQRASLKQRQDEMTRLLRDTYPNVQAVIDAPVQMQRETERLRTVAGRASPDDLEALLEVAASAWPPGVTLAALQYEGRTLTLGATDWAPPQIDQFRGQLQAAGFNVQVADGRIALSRARP